VFQSLYHYHRKRLVINLLYKQTTEWYRDKICTHWPHEAHRQHVHVDTEKQATQTCVTRLTTLLAILNHKIVSYHTWAQISFSLQFHKYHIYKVPHVQWCCWAGECCWLLYRSLQLFLFSYEYKHSSPHDLQPINHTLHCRYT